MRCFYNHVVQEKNIHFVTMHTCEPLLGTCCSVGSEEQSGVPCIIVLFYLVLSALRLVDNASVNKDTPNEIL